MIEALKAVLANTFAFYLKAHIYHWNVVAPMFSALHEFFGTLYEDAHGAVDGIAERLRTLDAFAPSTPSALFGGAQVSFVDGAPDWKAMVADLNAANNTVMASLNVAIVECEKAGKVGISNFLQDRLDTHAKFGWQLRSIQ